VRVLHTFFLARRYYFKATNGAPYELERQPGASVQNYARSIDYSKKVLGQYSKSKWVDDAYLMWAKNLIGRDDPLQTVTMLQNYASQFPKSELKPEAEFYLGLAYRNARKYGLAVAAFDNFLQVNKHPLLPYAHYERSRALMSMQRYSEAAEAAAQVLTRWPKHLLADRALRQRAEARLQQGDYAGAREDFRTIGRRAITDNDRFDFFMREVDCQSAREYDSGWRCCANSRTLRPLPYSRASCPRRFGQVRAAHTCALARRTCWPAGSTGRRGVPQGARGLPQERHRRRGASTGHAYETVADDFDRAGQGTRAGQGAVRHVELHPAGADAPTTWAASCSTARQRRRSLGARRKPAS
jgi:tetratricopeptide (TPR) repeat protein